MSIRVFVVMYLGTHVLYTYMLVRVRVCLRECVNDEIFVILDTITGQTYLEENFVEKVST